MIADSEYWPMLFVGLLLIGFLIWFGDNPPSDEE